MSPSQPTRSASRASATHSAVASPAMPATTGTRRPTATRQVRRISIFSLNERVAASPSEPRGTTALHPLSASHETWRASASWSTDRSDLNGVVIAGNTPCQSCRFITHPWAEGRDYEQERVNGIQYVIGGPAQERPPAAGSPHHFR